MDDENTVAESSRCWIEQKKWCDSSTEISHRSCNNSLRKPQFHPQETINRLNHGMIGGTLSLPKTLKGPIFGSVSPTVSSSSLFGKP